MNSYSTPAQALITTCFHGVTSPGLAECVTHLISYMQAVHRAYTAGPLRQHLVIAYRNPAAGDKPAMVAVGRAELRLELRNGLLYALHLNGHLDAALARVEEAAGWLAVRPCDPASFDGLGQTLSDWINGDRPSEEHCQVSLAVRATMAPATGISGHMAIKMALAALNLRRRAHGLAPLAEAPDVLKDQIAELLDGAACAVSRYINGLHSHAVALIQAFRARYHHRYDDIRIYNFLARAGGQRGRYRIQAMQELPWLLHVLAGIEGMYGTGSETLAPERRTELNATHRIVESIDDGLPLFDAVATAFGVPRETVRWTRRTMLPQAGPFKTLRLDWLLRMLSWIAPEKRPREGADWHAMRPVISSLLQMLDACSERASGRIVITEASLHGMVMTRWIRDLACPDLRHGAARLDTMAAAGEGVDELKDYLRVLQRSLCRFCSAETGVGQEPTARCAHALLRWLATQSFHRIVALSRHWHASMALCQLDHVAAPGSLRLSPDWPPVLLQPVRVGTLSIVELTNNRQLVEEGRRMQHCVGGYGAACAMQDSVIVSLRSSVGRSLSTAQLAIGGKPVGVTLRQHKGKRNALPAEECDAALAVLLGLLRKEEFHKRLADRRAFQQNARGNHDAAARLLAAQDAQYRALEEEWAWKCTFGPIPEHPLAAEQILDADGRTASSLT